MKVGFIGLGTMGQHMATNLQQAGYELVVNDIRRTAGTALEGGGAEWADSPADVMRATEVVFTSLPMPDDLKQVALGPSGLMEAITPGKVLFDMSTNSPTFIRDLHGVFAEHGVEVMDSPVSGGPEGARTRKMAILVGGAEEVFAKYEAVLEAMGDQVIYVGPSGAGCVAKLVHNCASQVIAATFAETMSVGVRAGVDPLTLWKAIRQCAAGRRRSFDIVRFLEGNFEVPSFRLGLAHKDVSLAVALGKELDVPMPLSNVTLEEMTEGLERGWVDKDSTSYLHLQVERAKVDIAVPKEEIAEEMGRG